MKDKRINKGKDTIHPLSMREQAIRLVEKLRKREIKMAHLRKEYKRDGMIVTVYGKGVDLSAVEHAKESADLLKQVKEGV